MYYHRGGELLTLLSKFEYRLPEAMAEFYIGKITLATWSKWNRKKKTLYMVT